MTDIQERSIRVGVFTSERVPKEYQNKFHRLMKEWDGGEAVSLAFYDISVLEMKLAEAMGA